MSYREVPPMYRVTITEITSGRKILDEHYFGELAPQLAEDGPLLKKIAAADSRTYWRKGAVPAREWANA